MVVLENTCGFGRKGYTNKCKEWSFIIEINACRVNLDNRDIIERKEESYLKKKICKYCRGITDAPNTMG